MTDVRHYSLKDGHVIAFETRTTPARGRELTFLQQLFNATPGVPLGNQNGRRLAAAAAARRAVATPDKEKARDCSRPFSSQRRCCSLQRPCARVASSSSATMLVILIIGLTAGPAVSL